jgi:hypothetical protein
VDPYFVTRWGKEVAAEGPKGLDLTRARRRLGVELHQRLAEPLRKLVRVGAFEEAACTALRAVSAMSSTRSGALRAIFAADECIEKRLSAFLGIA